MVSPEDLHTWIDEFASIYGNEPWVWYAIEIATALVALCGVLVVVLNTWSKLREAFEQLRALFFDSERKQRIREHRRFAGHLEMRLERLNERESWDDSRFAELEAEVEGPLRERIFPWLPRVRLPALRRQRLSRALQRSSARLILLQGEPGSGKSVALRHVALLMAQKAARKEVETSKIPIYVNLKLLRPDPCRGVDRDLIEDFVSEQLAGNRDIDAYLEQEFEIGMKEGRWVFLFDSFDEIPDILRSTGADETVHEYANAIEEFLHGMGACRGVIASRLFRGPKTLRATEFRIAPLDRAQRLDLLRRAKLDAKSRRALRLWMDGVAGSMQRELGSPMFVGMLCAQARGGFEEPTNAHRVYEDYITHLLTRDAQRLDDRFGVEVDELRTFAEKVAFYMTAEGLGLEPSLEALSFVLFEHEKLSKIDIENYLRALAYVKLAKLDDERGQTFTFAHRRFQEFFSTCVLLREPSRVDPRSLLTHAAWRESTVVLLQTSAAETLTLLLDEAGILLHGAVERLFGDTLDHSAGFEWPQDIRHVCAILQDGLRARRELLTDEARDCANTLIESAYFDGTHLDRKWALEVAGACSNEFVSELLTHAFGSGSVLLADAAFWQLHELAEIPHEVADSVSSRLIAWAKSGVLERERHKLAAYVARTDFAEEWGATIQVLAYMRTVMVALNGLILVLALVLDGPSAAWTWAVVLTAFALAWLWRPIGWFCRLVVFCAWFPIIEVLPIGWLWLIAVALALSWDWATRVAVEFQAASLWVFRVCPWLIFPLFGGFMVSMIKVRAMGMFLLKLVAGLLGVVAFFFVLMGAGLAIEWFVTEFSARAPGVAGFLGGAFMLLLYIVGSVIAIAVGLFIVTGIWRWARGYLRFIRNYRTVQRGGVGSVEELAEMLASTLGEGHRVRIVELVRECGSLPVTREVIAALRLLEREVDEGGGEPEVLDAYARLAESLIERRAGAA